MQSADWADIWANMRCPGLSPTEQSFLFKMVNGLLPSKSKLLRFGIEENDQCFFCNEKDDKDHFLSCTQASSMGEATRNILSWIENQRNIQDPATERVAALDDGSGVAVATSQDSE